MNSFTQNNSKVIQLTNYYFGIPRETLLLCLYSILAILGYLILIKIIHKIITIKTKEISRQYILKKVSRYLSGFLLLVILFKIWFGFGGGGEIAAYFGILSAGLAIALKDPLTNLAGWFFITFRKPLAVGNRIQIGDIKGDVIDLRLFQFSLVEIGNWVDADQSTGRIIHIPNGWIFKHFQANYTEGFNFIWNEICVTITFESDWKKAKSILLDTANKHTVIKSEEAALEIKRAAQKYMIFFQYLTPIVWLNVIDNGVTLTIRYLCDPKKRRSSESIIWEEILSEFNEHSDINFAYPTTRFYTPSEKPLPPSLTT